MSSFVSKRPLGPAIALAFAASWRNRRGRGVSSRSRANSDSSADTMTRVMVVLRASANCLASAAARGSRMVSITFALIELYIHNYAVVNTKASPMPLAVNRDHNLIKTVTVAKLRCVGADFVGMNPSEFLSPRPHCFMANDDPVRRRKILDHSRAERKPKIQPNCLLDNRRRNSIATIKGFRRLDHEVRLAPNRRDFVNLTVPQFDKLHIAQLLQITAIHPAMDLEIDLLGKGVGN